MYDRRYISRRLQVMILLLAWLLGTAPRLYAQYIRQLNGNQLLGASEIYHIAKDRAGFLWFCTDHGLVKYDGSNLQHYTKQDGLADNMVFNIYEDHEGRIWPFCYNGNYCFIDNDSVHNAYNDSLLAALPHTGSYIVYMAQGADSTLYMGCLNRTLLRFKTAGECTVDKIWDTGKNLLVTKDRVSFFAGAPEYLTVIVPGADIRLVSDGKGIKIYNNTRLNWQLDDPALTGHAVRDLCLTADGRLLVATSHGLELVDLSTRQKKEWLKGLRLSSCVADINGNFWISGTNGSIYVLQRGLDRIHPLPGFDGRDLIPVNDGKQLLVKDSTLYELRAEKQGIVPVLVKRNVRNYWNPILCFNGFTGFYDTWKSNVHIWYGDKRKVYRKPFFIKSMHPLADNRFFVRCGYMSGVVVWDGQSFTGMDHLAVHAQKINALCQHPQTKDIYFATGDTVYRYAGNGSRNVPVWVNPESKNITGMLCVDSCLLMAVDRDYYYSCSLNTVNMSPARHPVSFTVRSFLPLDAKRCIALSDDAAYICDIHDPDSSPRKICFPFINYEQLAIVGSNCLVRSDGRYYYFDTSLFNRYKPVHKVYIKSLLVNGKPCRVPEAEVRNTAKVTVQLNLGLISFDNGPREVQYRLTGPDEDGRWHRHTAAAELVFVLGRAGDYRLEVAPAGGGRTGTMTVLHLVIHTPFFQSVLFYVLCLVLVVLVCICIAWLVLRYRKKAFTKEFNYLRMEHKAINALLNPHFIFNSINNIQGLIHDADKQEAADYLAILSRLIRQNLENLEHNLVPVQDELDLIHRYVRLQNLRFEGNIQLHTDMIQQDVFAVKIPPLLLHTFVENAIVHGYRFRDQPFHIYISIANDTVADYLRIVIADNGVGIHAADTAAGAHAKSSMGISFSRKRLARISDFYKLQQSISVKDRSEDGGQGTEVTVILYARLDQLLEQKKWSAH